MIVDGRKIAERVYRETADIVSQLPRAPKMTAVTCAPNFETQKYLNLKKRKAAEVGISLNIVELPKEVTTQEAVACIERVAIDSDGVVVQLPFPEQVDRGVLLRSVPENKDPDCFNRSTESTLLPPVAGAVDEIAKQHEINWQGKRVVIVGHGLLVGKPVEEFVKKMGADTIVVTEETKDVTKKLLEADIVVSGVGKPQFIHKEMVKKGVIIFDAGTSEEGGELVGDVYPDVANKALLFTPVPGGIGPITVSVLLRNLAELVARQ